MKLIYFMRTVLAAVASILFAITAILTIPFERSGKAFHQNSRLWARTVLFLCNVRVRVRGAENLGDAKSYVYVSNHASLIDIPIIIAGIPDQIRIVYKKELEKIPFFGWGLKWGSYIGIDRGSSVEARRSLTEALEKIRNGASVLLYAEGTRTLDGKLQPFKRGAFHIAVEAGVPVVPVTINGSFSIIRKHSMTAYPGSVELVLSPPIYLTIERGKEAELKLMEQVHAAIAENYIDQ
jgi:1-acyl-sn-glycerol-3-phosphate acyltransferase